MGNLVNFWNKNDKYYLLPVLSSVVVVFIITVLYLVYFTKLPGKLPLFYSLPWGETQLVKRDQFFILPAIVILFTLTNSFLSYHLHPSQYLLRRILLLTLFPINLIILIAVVKILSIFI